MPSPASTSTSMSSMFIDLSESNLTIRDASPTPSISSSESYPDRSAFQPRIDSAFKQITSFQGNIYIYYNSSPRGAFVIVPHSCYYYHS